MKSLTQSLPLILTATLAACGGPEVDAIDSDAVIGKPAPIAVPPPPPPTPIPGPTLTVVDACSGMILLHGEHFSPGGRVRLTIVPDWPYDSWQETFTQYDFSWDHKIAITTRVAVRVIAMDVDGSGLVSNVVEASASANSAPCGQVDHVFQRLSNWGPGYDNARFNLSAADIAPGGLVHIEVIRVIDGASMGGAWPTADASGVATSYFDVTNGGNVCGFDYFARGYDFTHLRQLADGPVRRASCSLPTR